MGIRVHKVVGWGFDDIKTRNGCIADGRIRNSSPLLDYEDFNLQEYLEFVEAKGDTHNNMDRYLYNHTDVEKPKLTTWDLVHWGDEYMMKQIMVIVPVSMTKEWYRYDNAIDWVEETYFQKETSQINRYEKIPHGIYPWIGIYMDKRDGTILNNDDMHLWNTAHWKDEPVAEIANVAATNMGFTSYEEAQDCIVPRVPEEIKDLIEYGKLFKKDDAWLQLRPMLYVYWR